LDKQARGLGKLFCAGRAPLATLLGNYAQKEIVASSDMKSITKGLKTLPIAQVDKLRSMGGPPACLTEIQQKRTCLQIPAQSQIF
jgi:hypothetical protein